MVNLRKMRKPECFFSKRKREGMYDGENLPGNSKMSEKDYLQKV